MRNPPQTASCLACGKKFTFYASTTSGRYCSPACYQADRWGKSHKVTAVCSICGKSREYYQSEVDIGCGVTCGSIECRSATLRDQAIYTCQWCGSNFQFAASRPRQFCSRACYTEARKIRDGSHGNKSGAWRAWQRDEWLEDSCCRCGSTENLELDHIIPVACNGMSVRSNAQTLCRKCHTRKRVTEDRKMLAKIGKKDH